MIDGLILDNDASWTEACRRYNVLSEERRAERERAKRSAFESNEGRDRLG